MPLPRFDTLLANVYKGEGKQARIVLTVGIIAYSFSMFVLWFSKKVERSNKRKLIKNRSINIGAIFGMDVGGSLAKLIYFEKEAGKSNSNGQETGNKMSRSDSFVRLDNPDHQAALKKLYSQINEDKVLLSRDEQMSFYSPDLGGRIHFLHFETRNMVDAINILSENSMMENIHTIGCTGGGAHRFETEFNEQLGIKVEFQDELAALIRGMLFVMGTVKGECYTYRPPRVDNTEAGTVQSACGIKSGSDSVTVTASASDSVIDSPDDSADIPQELQTSKYKQPSPVKDSGSHSIMHHGNSSSNNGVRRRSRVYSDGMISTPASIRLSFNNNNNTSNLNAGATAGSVESPSKLNVTESSAFTTATTATVTASVITNDKLTRTRSRTDSFHSPVPNASVTVTASAPPTPLRTIKPTASAVTATATTSVAATATASNANATKAKAAYEYTELIELDASLTSSSSSFPYLIVNIGSGVSILKVTSPKDFERVSGSSVGGGTYWGLMRLLTGASTYSQAIQMSEEGNATEVDMLVRDIYGGGYDSIGLAGGMVASSFGKLVMKDETVEGGIMQGITDSDIAQALLMMITNNIGQVAYLNAKLHGCSKILFMGNFLRQNPVSCRKLAFAINFWSKGETEATFFRHEGYFGALGTFLSSAFGSSLDLLLESIIKR